MTLRDLPIGKTATIRSVGGEGALRQHFLDMGLIPQGEVTVVKYAPMGDPMELRIHSYELTLRLADAEKIEIEHIRDAGEAGPEKKRKEPIPHPGLGEGGKYHEKETEHPLPDGETLTFALAGNQNCGKTTLFNQLTGSNQHVGNFPGVTVDRKDGSIRGKEHTLVTDLPAGTSEGDYQYRGCDKYRTKPVPDHAADGTGYSDGACAEYDGRGTGKRRIDPGQSDGRNAWYPCCSDIGGKK